MLKQSKLGETSSTNQTMNLIATATKLSKELKMQANEIVKNAPRSYWGRSPNATAARLTRRSIGSDPGLLLNGLSPPAQSCRDRVRN